MNCSLYKEGSLYPFTQGRPCWTTYSKALLLLYFIFYIPLYCLTYFLICVRLGCGNNPADIVFVLDESGSIWSLHFKQQLQSVQDIIESFDIGFNRTHVGVMTFGTSNRVIFPLGKYTDESELKAAVAGKWQSSDPLALYDRYFGFIRYWLYGSSNSKG